MNIKLSPKIMKDMCGTVSFKRGEAFYRANKVTFTQYDENVCEAIVTGAEEFHVTIQKGERSIHTKCSCPQLSSFQKDCQHIAAVLLSIYEKQRQGTSAIEVKSSPLAEGFISLFQLSPVQSSGSQQYFENRQVLELGFTLKPFDKMMAIGIELDSTFIQDIRFFLKQVQSGQTYPITPTFTYHPKNYCFHQNVNKILEQLIKVMVDETFYQDIDTNKRWLFIPPSLWDNLLHLLKPISLVKLEYFETVYEKPQVSTDPLSLEFHLRENQGYQLEINGLDEIIVLKAYQTVLSKGKIFRFKNEDCQRLIDMKKMLKTKNYIPIPADQLAFFKEKIIPGLKTLGGVQLADELAHQMLKVPLQAKLYLDRVNNRLLASLEFQYDHILFNPLEEEKLEMNPLLIRDVQKEETILQLMDDSSFAKTDSGYYMQNEELEYEFLHNIIPKLEKFVVVYATTAVRNRVIGVGVGPRIRIKMRKERMNWLEFKFELDGIPDKQIREVLQALEEKRKYYRLKNGSLLSLETKEFQRLQQFLNEIPLDPEDMENELDIPIAKGMRLLDILEEHRDLLTIEESFQQFLNEISHPELLDFKIPARLDSVLRDYQKNGFKWFKTLAHYGFGGILADDMGLGKTLQSISFIVSELDSIREKKQPVLIVCPTSLTYNWQSELMKFAPELQALIIDGDKQERFLLQKDGMDSDVLITSYPLLRADIKWYEKQPFHMVFFDEAQAFKNPFTQTAKAVKKVRATHSFALTGTPIENSLEELWSIFHVVFPGLLGTLKEFSHLRTETVSRRIKPFLLRRKKEDVLRELPEKTEDLVGVDLLPDQKKLYAAYLAKLRQDSLKHLDKETFRKNRIKILAGLTRLRQICCHPSLFVDGYKGSSAKFEQVLQLLEEAQTSQRRVLIFSQFTKMLNLIGKELTTRGISYFYLDGQTPSEERVDLCDRFNSGERDFFLISLKAGGTGLNLTGADTVILYDLWWNPAVEEQAMDRAHRIGQTKEVQVFKLISRGTIEEKINELQAKKKDLITNIIDSDAAATSVLTEEDIRELLS
ncbi:DEAD/DEAH box helicase [Niallia sp. XMNu-256]|uniref:DEAD/DEAH box helicase n=1 Tax=Niallia sp. XMNu-256 TaxID=3082444 RepID=UPI0030CAE03A